MKRLFIALFSALLVVLSPAIAHACGAYFAAAVVGQTAIPQSSTARVIIYHEALRQGNSDKILGYRTIQMEANTVAGDVQKFVRIIPVPTVPKREQVRLGTLEAMNTLDALTSPRLELYQDTPWVSEYRIYGFLLAFLLAIGALIFLVFNPRTSRVSTRILNVLSILAFSIIALTSGLLIIPFNGYLGLFFLLVFLSLFGGFIYLIKNTRTHKLGTILGFVIFVGALLFVIPSYLGSTSTAGGALPDVAATVEIADQFTLGEYDITILSAKESDGLIQWLGAQNYQVPASAKPILQSYINDGLKFFVVRINLPEFKKQGGQFLRPIIIEYESKSPEVPYLLKLSTLNGGNKDQNLSITLLGSGHQLAQPLNYAFTPIPSDLISRKNQFSGRELPKFIENNFDDFYQAVLDQTHHKSEPIILEFVSDRLFSEQPDILFQEMLGSRVKEVAMQTSGITRFHVRYNRETAPEDLRFKFVEADGENAKIASFYSKHQLRLWSIGGYAFYGRYVMRECTRVGLACIPYGLKGAVQKENLQKLTGWSDAKIQRLQSQKS
ncbi:hypothetical protein GlitD10_0154 [Gloeomargarita lithophora Alchichica-D10]|uniref:Uncharacterized protein n=1 Tax=Gloeomargarita lithophora Alchichica-D10 TaxID=1188229 RepID=A0A1J0A963_9CYAN|nr:DUF2330 domain-containing protein [Gloeomargarita lithophora]APB32455.1 hypothetical protein GlitD10_0154 [Gloeomargarita lithophora Alchichica-D10]